MSQFYVFYITLLRVCNVTVLRVFMSQFYMFYVTLLRACNVTVLRVCNVAVLRVCNVTFFRVCNVTVLHLSTSTCQTKTRVVPPSVCSCSAIWSSSSTFHTM